MSDESCASLDLQSHPHILTLSPQLCLVSLCWWTARTQTQFSLVPWIRSAFRDSVLQRRWDPSCCLRIYAQFFCFSVEFFPSRFARRELRAADVWAVMFLHCHNLRCYSKCCHAQLQCELASRVKELTHRHRLSWHFLESPHASYGGVKWVENVRFLQPLFKLGKGNATAIKCCFRFRPGRCQMKPWRLCINKEPIKMSWKEFLITFPTHPHISGQFRILKDFKITILKLQSTI